MIVDVRVSTPELAHPYVVRGVRVVLGNSSDQRATDERLQVRFDRIRQRLSVHFITVHVEREGFEIFRLLFGILDRRLCPRVKRVILGAPLLRFGHVVGKGIELAFHCCMMPGEDIR